MLCRFLAAFLLLNVFGMAGAQTAPVPEGYISPSRPVPVGHAPGMQSRLVREGSGEHVYAIIFATGDDPISGLTDFAVAHKITDAHFTAIGAVQGGLLAWFDLAKKAYKPLPVTEQSEVIAMTGDIAVFQGKPIVHAHTLLSHADGGTMGGHTFELRVNPTLEVFLTADDTPLAKREDISGLKLIDPTH